MTFDDKIDTDADYNSSKAFAQLQSQIKPSFSDVSDHLYVPFKARRLRHARVAWLNSRWFSSLGVDCTCDITRAEVEKWLVERFAVSVPSEDDPPGQYLSDEVVLFADRYGAPSGSSHGGSGRVGTFGAFNAKGIGRTPLVSRHSDWYHSHGCMFLEEAIREAIISEIAESIFPYKAVPTVAIINTGVRLRWRDGTLGARRAIAIRPAFLRVANLMRTIYFGSCGYTGSDQAADALCVRDIWDAMSADSVSTSMYAMGEQYGFGNALRLWPGPLFPSNFTLQGGLVDFGSFRALPNWQRAQGESRAHSFGGEISLAAATARSLARNGLRCGLTLDPQSLLGLFRQGFDRGYRKALAIHGIYPGSVLDIQLDKARMQQQRKTTDLTGGRDTTTIIGSLQPWVRLYREDLLVSTESMISLLGNDVEGNSSAIGKFIQDYLAGIRSSAYFIAAARACRIA